MYKETAGMLTIIRELNWQKYAAIITYYTSVIKITSLLILEEVDGLAEYFEEVSVWFGLNALSSLLNYRHQSSTLNTCRANSRAFWHFTIYINFLASCQTFYVVVVAADSKPAHIDCWLHFKFSHHPSIKQGVMYASW